MEGKWKGEARKLGLKCDVRLRSEATVDHSNFLQYAYAMTR